MSTWLIVNGSPRRHGRCGAVCDALSQRIMQRYPEITLHRFDIAESKVHGCVNCGSCSEAEIGYRTCVYDDDGNQFLDSVRCAEQIFFVVPVYFAGLPSQAKACIDRLQPCYYDRLELKSKNCPLPAKSPLYVYIIGDGGDPHGYEGVVSSLRSSFALADFSVREIFPLIGETAIDFSHLPFPKELS